MRIQAKPQKNLRQIMMPKSKDFLVNSEPAAEKEKVPHRRVTALSRLDRERLERGEIACPEEALHIHDAKRAPAPERAAWRQKKVTAEAELSPREKEILAELPPHFGKL